MPSDVCVCVCVFLLVLVYCVDVVVMLVCFSFECFGAYLCIRVCMWLPVCACLCA
jgi:hypothetical protein